MKVLKVRFWFPFFFFISDKNCFIVVKLLISLLSFLIILSPFDAKGQSVGLVLSGGGAKGVAHIGLIQALEDNGIPIDFIAGTSIGAVVGGLYAMGFSPGEMMELIKSKEFSNWMTGTIENRYIDFFGKPNPTPEFISTSISLKDTVFNTGKMLPNSLVNPIQMNLAFLQLCTQATAQCQGNFNNLFVPFRSVAANISSRTHYVFKNGDLGDAIRASMSFPFVFKAIKVDGKLLYDGGIYNNYPVDVMINDFNPDKMVGSIVTDVSSNIDDYDMAGQLRNMIMQPSNYKLPEEKGVQLQFNLNNVSLLDFYKADSVFRVGYDGAMVRMEEIKKMVPARVDPFSINLKRALFKSHIPVLRFREIEINGATEIQKEYILKVLDQDGTSYFTLEDLKVGYFKLLSDKKFTEIRPHALYNENDNSFKLILDVELENSIDIAIGANVSSSTSNQLFMGVVYRILNQFSQNYSADAYIGKILNAFRLSSTFRFSGKTPQYFSTELANLNYNFYQGERLFYQDEQPAFIKQHEFFLKFRYGLPALSNGKVELGLSGGILYDRYMQTKLESFSDKSFDKSTYSMINTSVRFEQNNLNDKQFPTSGKRYYLTGQAITGIESFRYADSVGNFSKRDVPLSYLQLSGGFEKYLHFKSGIIIGSKGELVYNNKRVLDNYSASIIQAPAYTPTLHSKSSFNEAYRSNQYIAIGVMPIWTIRSSLYLRTEFYGFFPLTMLKLGENKSVINSHSWSNIQYIVESSLVYQLPFTSLSLFLNNYSYPKGNWNFGLNIGFLLFGKRFVE